MSLKKIVGSLFIMLIVLSGCSKSADSSSNSDVVELEFMMSEAADRPMMTTLQEITDQYMEENPNIKITIVPAASDYESVIKTRLASKDAPDMWGTHGWSLLRYSDFLIPLTDQSWNDEVNPALDASMRDEEGNIYALPLDMDYSGIAYNKDIYDEVGINPDDLKTWDDFYAAQLKIKDAGYTPIGLPGNDTWTNGFLGLWILPGLIDDETRDKMVEEGYFPKDEFLQFYQMIKKAADSELFSLDQVSLNTDMLAQQFVNGEIANEFLAIKDSITLSLEYKPDMNIGIMPIPNSNGSPYMISGENIAIGISNQSEHKEEAIDYLNYLVEPENYTKLITSIGGTPALGIDIDYTLPYEAELEKNMQYETEPYFDRAYLPNGSWDTLYTTVQSVTSGTQTPESATDTMESKYNELFKQQKNEE